MLDLEIIGRGATTKIYRDGDTAVKLYLNTSPEEAYNEAERQRFAYEAGLPVPAVYGVRTLNADGVALDMEYVNGQPLMRPGMSKDERHRAIHALVRLQRETHRVHAGGLPKQTDCLAWKIKNSSCLDETRKNSLLSLLARLDNRSEQLCHGDLHPLNILFDGAKHWIIDWVDAAAGNPLADACRTYIILRNAFPRWARTYLRVFCEEARTKPDDALVWQPVIAAARLSENPDKKAKAWLLNKAAAPAGYGSEDGQ